MIWNFLKNMIKMITKIIIEENLFQYLNVITISIQYFEKNNKFVNEKQ
jgi:hypothetical protein